jgi:hypothetical protein
MNEIIKKLEAAEKTIADKEKLLSEMKDLLKKQN